VVAAAERYLHPLALRGLRAGAFGLTALLGVGTLTFVVATAFSVDRVRTMFADSASDAGSLFGLLLLCLGYLPNVALLAVGFTVGPGFSIGQTLVTPFRLAGGQVPEIPLLAAVPDEHARWWPLLLLLPAAVGALVGWSLRHTDEHPLTRLRSVVVAGALVGFGTVVLGTLAGGRLGNGPFDPVALPLGVLSASAFGWIAVPGAVVAWLAGPRGRPHSATSGSTGSAEHGGNIESPDRSGDDPGDGDHNPEPAS
jgi:hypothetical protein